MTLQITGARAPEYDYAPCRYGAARLFFRGPERDLGAPFVACIGGTETFGKFVDRPYPALLDQAQERAAPVVNFGAVNAGVDAFVRDPALVDLLRPACASVVQVMGAQHLSNRFYSVHPRRNDRFVRASAQMRTMFGGVDLTELHFNNHLLQALQRARPRHYGYVLEELASAWVSRMMQLLRRLPRPVILLWMGQGDVPERLGLPLYVTREMLAAVAGYVDEVVEVPWQRRALSAGGVYRMGDPLAVAAAQDLPDGAAHEAAARALAPALRRLLI